MDVTHTAVRTAKRLQICSVRFGFCLNDVGIRARIAVEGSDPVVIERIGSQASHILTSHIAYVQIMIAGCVSNKRAGRGDV
jgi:hypothetical protein